MIKQEKRKANEGTTKEEEGKSKFDFERKKNGKEEDKVKEEGKEERCGQLNDEQIKQIEEQKCFEQENLKE